ncbi:hypothetical protein [Amycolatopsis sp. WAC 04197]|uniref:hypothetical protein n=1 Tax=Amycolatopsis sp. WAC 04197 TaxID=2203199 RepID=UPI000F776A04|nr:hypothetical protein [Amycolatopsis sp. WAC 04197]
MSYTQPAADRFVGALRTAYRGLIESGAVSLAVDHGDAETIVRLEPTASGAPRLELRMTGSVGELFLDDLDPFEVDETSPDDVEEFASFTRALVDGQLELVSRKTLLGWRPAAVEWPGGQWSLPGNPGIVGLFFRPRTEKVRGYVQTETEDRVRLERNRIPGPTQRGTHHS